MTVILNLNIGTQLKPKSKFRLLNFLPNYVINT